MEFNRNHYMFLGVVILLLGLQLRMVQSYVLNAKATRFLAQSSSGESFGDAMASFTDDVTIGTRRVVRPPEWLGWCLISVGAVLILHSLAMPRPG